MLLTSKGSGARTGCFDLQPVPSVCNNAYQQFTLAFILQITLTRLGCKHAKLSWQCRAVSPCFRVNYRLARYPSSTLSVVPVMKLAPLDNRKPTAAATSSGLPSLHTTYATHSIHPQPPTQQTYVRSGSATHEVKPGSAK